MVDLNSNKEVNARFSARGAYYRWLVQQHGSIPMLELQEDNQDPISLRKIFIPLRLDLEDRDESSINPPENFHTENDNNQLGQDAFNEIGKYDFLVISGRPGAGKTTLIKALINELCGSHSSKFRTKIHKECGAIFTMPVILRELPEIENINSLDDLLAQWWARLDSLNQLAFDKKLFNERLDLINLKASLKNDDLQPLILFDGIDEVGSFDLRSKIYHIAQDAHHKGYRVILTGRPSGLADLQKVVKSAEFRHGENELKHVVDNLTESEIVESQTPSDKIGKKIKETLISLYVDNDNTYISSRDDSQEKWRYIQPLTRPQIDLFIKKWYQLDPTWVSKFGTHPKEFKAALADPKRDHLLPLARRPIFLSLMAIVHCTKNEMPHGRAELYKTIVDVYLTRQRKHRRLKQTTTGESMPQWDSHEPRTALGYLAWLSMCKGNNNGAENKNDRRILWKREDMEAELQFGLTSVLRFNEVTSEDASSLISYYLNPAGLLIEPEEGYIQFAHLSFQEYLCAEYLQGKMSGRHIEKQWREYVLNNLKSSGWHEVALLLLTVHANKTQNRGHFELISYLDVNDYNQAQLMFCALLGKELPIQSGDRKQWLVLLIMVALVHPNMPEIKYFKDWEDLNNVGFGHILKILSLFNNINGDAVWSYLLQITNDDSSRYWREEYFDDYNQYLYKITERWKKPYTDESWEVESCAQEAQRFSLLNLLLESQWGGYNTEDLKQPLESNELQDVLSKIYNKPTPWTKKETEWEVYKSFYLFENCFNYGSVFEKVIRESMPVSLWLLLSESSFMASSVLHSIESDEAVSEYRTRLSLTFYQWSKLLDVLPFGEKASNKQLRKEQISIDLDQHKLHRRPRHTNYFSSYSTLKAATTVLSVMVTLSGKINKTSFTNMIPLLLSANNKISLPWYESNKSLFSSIEKIDPNKVISDNRLKNLSNTIAFTGANFMAWKWFMDQHNDPILTHNRGGRNGEPLPFNLGLFDSKGLPNQIQNYDDWLKFQEWSKDNENWLNFVFPDEKLKSNVRKLLLSDMDELKLCKWSPYERMDKMLIEWPKNNKSYDCSMEFSEKIMVQEIEKILEKY